MYLNNAWRSLNHYAKCCVYSRIQWGRDDAVVDLGGYLGTLKINHIALSNYTTRTLFHFVIFKNFLAGGGHPLLHHPRTQLYTQVIYVWSPFWKILLELKVYLKERILEVIDITLHLNLSHILAKYDFVKAYQPVLSNHLISLEYLRVLYNVMLINYSIIIKTSFHTIILIFSYYYTINCATLSNTMRKSINTFMYT